MMSSSDLAVFEAVARAEGIGRAAVALHTVQSNVTARVQHLEEQLGARLFDRHRHGVTLTSAGQRLLPYAARVRELLAEAERAVARDAAPSGTLAIGALETTAALRLPPVLAAFGRACPDVDVALHTGTSASLTADVLARRLEGAFVAGPVRHADLVDVRVFEEELVIVTSRARATWAPAGDAAKIVVFRAGCSYRQRLEQILATRGVVAVRRLELGTVDGIVGCVAAGLGLTLLPRAVVEAHARAGDVAVHPLPRGKGRVHTVFVRRRDGFVSRAQAALLDVARATARDGARDAVPVRRARATSRA